MKLYLFFISILLAACNSDYSSANRHVNRNSVSDLNKYREVMNHNSSKSMDTVSEELFDAFFDRFDKDSIFQYSRIKFPLKVTTEEETHFLTEKKWKFTTLSNKQAIKGQIKKVKIDKGEVKVEYSIEDTGVLVNHFFHIKEGRWWLAFIQDSSD